MLLEDRVSFLSRSRHTAKGSSIHSGGLGVNSGHSIDLGLVMKDEEESLAGSYRRYQRSNESSTGSLDSFEIEIMEEDLKYDYDDEEAKIAKSYRQRFNMSVRLVAVLSVVLIALTFCGACAAVWFSLSGQSITGMRGSKKKNRLPVTFQCPASPVNKTVKLQFDYDALAKEHSENLTEFFETFRDANYDAWGKTYKTVKDAMTPFKAKYFPPYLQKAGSTLYESACGIGLNLYMTLEILQDHSSNTDVVVYGNEVVEESAKRAQRILGHQLPGNAKLGTVCHADSLDLSHVPSNSFDVSYSGYITPVLDPLGLLIAPKDYTRYRQLCYIPSHPGHFKNETLWMADKLLSIMQQTQEDWYGKWVADFARIAKPGAPVMVEQVSSSFCKATIDWGGVDKDFWTRHATANTYGWNVDPASIEFMDDSMFPGRYHVFMLRNRE
jgi:hypothetical protein